MKPLDVNLLTKVLGWSAVFGLLITTVWFGTYLTGTVCYLHVRLFNLTLHECELLSYGGLAVTKILMVVFFVLPWLSIKLVSRKYR